MACILNNENVSTAKLRCENFSIAVFRIFAITQHTFKKS